MADSFRNNGGAERDACTVALASVAKRPRLEYGGADVICLDLDNESNGCLSHATKEEKSKVDALLSTGIAGGADVICLDSDNESDGCISGATKEEKPNFDAYGPCSLEKLKDIGPSSEDAICFLDKRLDSEEQGKTLSSGEKIEEDKLVTLEMEFVDSGLRKIAFEVVSEVSSHDFSEEIDLYKVENISKATESTDSEVFHHNKDEKGSTAESVEINSDVRELGNVSEAAINMSMGNNSFYMPDIAGNIGDMDPFESCKRGFEISRGMMNNVCVIQDSSEDESSSDSLDSPIYMKNERVNCTIGNAEICKDNGLSHNSIRGAVEQHMHIKSWKSTEGDMCQDKTDLAPKVCGNKRQGKQSGITRNEREEDRKHKQEEIARHKREKEEEKQRQKEEKRVKKEAKKMQKAAAKAEAAEMRKRHKEREKWEKGKFALKAISAEIDTKVIEKGLIAGHLLNRLAEKELCFHVVSNQVQSSIMWKMNMPDADAESPFKDYDIPYILVILEAEEFCNMASEGTLFDHVCSIQRLYPGYNICYLTNKLISYITKREQEQYKNPGNASSWKRPPVEQALAKFVTHFVGVHSRLCLDEAEVADHIAGLTRSLAECRFRQKLTRLSISANGSHVPNDIPNKGMIKKSVWLKALVAIPKLPPKCAVAIAKKYPTMRSLLNVYLDPERTVHEKEFLLQDIVTERLLGEGGRRLGPVCSKRVYRILMAQSGNLKTDDVEEGADLFES
ncbi:crossover junction endonuclease EME1B isoform X2 [Cryptomeria japonica]|uniref:crossover junction endonuclease EME1B isoform X2 n=1 Tax=Cryptomeria japonica TaxID=3369 RepID=UPI0025AB965D|nr:crossover junction endonuclease EME1B isoform X2 [Cryptomeria japonica]